MTLSGTSVRFETIASAAHSAVNVSGSTAIGTSGGKVTYTDAPTVAYSLAMSIQAGATLALNTATGAVTQTVFEASQVETQTISAPLGCTTAGNLTVTVTSALVTGSPLAISVPLTLDENTAALVAAEVRAALSATAAITDHYTVSGTGADYVLTAIVPALPDATLNLSHINDTSAGISSDATSVNTIAGSGISRAYKFSGVTWDATDFEGIALPTMTNLHSILVRSALTAGTVAIDSGTNSFDVDSPFVSLQSSPAGDHPFSAATVSFTAIGAPATLTIDIHAG